MAVDLGETNIDPSDPKFRPMLENLQGNVLKPHGRTESDHLLLQFTAGRQEVRTWIRRFAGEEVTSMKRQLDEGEAYRRRGTSGGVVANVALSARGYETLGLDLGAFGERGGAFRNGMKQRVFSLLARNRDPLPSEWEEPYRGDIHALVALAHDSPDVLEAKTRQISRELADIAEVLAIERGTVLRNAKGEAIEPFGFIDARSQPLFLRGDIQAEREHGVDLWEPSAPLGLVLVDDPHADEEDSFGSYLVFRKLGQDVAGFKAGVRDLARRLSVDEALAGALVVGRFQDGTPVTMQPSGGLGGVNNFEYVRQDGVGNRCPFHAHIRKANQRGANALLSPQEERSRRIVRRGVPYGIRPASRETGLLFMCFQGDIGRQFEFIQRSWVDNPNFPEFLLVPGLNTGDDALIGQHPRAAQKWPREWGRSGRVLGRRTFNFGDYIRLRGGEYFFTPSLASLRNL